MGIGNTGISPSYKVPRYIAKILLAAGAVSAASQRLKCLLVGKKTSAGSIVEDDPPVKVTDADDLDAKAGVGSQLAMMGYAALSVPSVELWIAAILEPVAGTAATVTAVIGGTWTTAGLLYFRVAGITIPVSVTATNTADEVGAAIVLAVNAKTRLPVTAAYSSVSKTVTFTTKNKGATEIDWILYYVPDSAPAGMTMALTGSAIVNTNGVRFGAASSGTGAEDATVLSAKLGKTRYARIALGHNGTQVQAQTLAQTTLNAFRASVMWLRNSENHPSQFAALIAAYRSVLEQDNPLYDWDAFELPYLAPQAFEGDIPSDTEQDTCLNNGVTPLTTVDGTVRVVRMITSYCLNGGVQDDRCLDIGDITVTDYATLDLKLLYETEFRPANPIVRDDPSPEEDTPTAGIGFPKLWNSKVVERLQEYYAVGWLAEPPTGAWAPVSGFDRSKGAIVTDTPLAVSRLQHRLDNVMRQIATVG